MKKLEIIDSGQFSDLGNFSTGMGDNRIFVSKKTMEAIGITNDAEFVAKAPLFAVVTTTTHGTYVSADDVENGLTDANGREYTTEDIRKTFRTYKDESGATQVLEFSRRTAESVFTEMEQAVNAVTASARAQIAVESAIAKARLESKVELDKLAKASELTPERLQQLSSLSF